MIIVTGGAGFIGSNLIKGLNDKGASNILIVDDLKDARKFKNIIGLDFLDIMPSTAFLERVNQILTKDCTIFHMGAITDTMETDGEMVMAYNYMYSISLLTSALVKETDFIYASSAAVYGNDGVPLNIYGYSKYLFDKVVMRKIPIAKDNKLIGLRYFNVYGPNEVHKDNMASAIYQFIKEALNSHQIRIFSGSDNYFRDFIHVDDVVKITLYMYGNDVENDIYDCGTGITTSFAEIAEIIKVRSGRSVGRKMMPEGLIDQYQTYTIADVTHLAKAGYKEDFISIQEGIGSYYDIIDENGGYSGKVA